MRKLLIILLSFLTLSLSGQLLERNTDEVWTGGFPTIATNSGFTGYYYFMRNTETVVHTAGAVNKIVIHVTTKPDSLFFELWHKDGASYDRIYREDINPKITAGVIDTIELASTAYPLQGDNVAIRMVGAGSMGFTTRSADSSMMYGSSSTYYDGVDDTLFTELSTAATQVLTVKLLGRAPLGVIIGNSIAAGHYGNYSAVESSIANDPLHSIGGQLYLLDTLHKWMNVATGSTTTTYLNQHFTDYVLALKPKYCLIESGVNDLATGNTKATFIANYTQFLDSLTANDVIPVVLKIGPWSNGSNVQMQARDDWMTDLEALLTNSYPDAVWVDFDTAVGQFRSGGDVNNLWDMQPSLAADGVHWNASGHTEIAYTVNAVLNPVAIDNKKYVAVNGNDNNPGTITQPWATWQKATSTAVRGDTVYFRGGTYMSLTSSAIANSGTADSLICFFGYPGETVILDCFLHCAQEPPVWGYFYNSAITANEKEYIHFKDFTIRNVFLCYENRVTGAIATSSCANLTFENVIIHQVGQRGYWMQSGAWTPADTVDYPGMIVANDLAPFAYDTTRFINCDVYELCDTLSTNPGNAADGWKLHTYYGNYYRWDGCRVWNYSDDGIDVSGQGTKILNNCWAMPSNKFAEFIVEGNGFKLGANHYRYIDGDTTINFVQVRNSLAVFGFGAGFYDLDYDDYQNNNPIYYNNTAYDMGYGFRSNSDRPESGIYRNNISYSSNNIGGNQELLDVFITTEGGIYPESHNTWDASIGYPYFVTTDSVTVTDADFVSVDSLTIVSQFTAARQADGSLPLLKPLRLVNDSDLRDAGIDVGITYSGLSPDLGYLEWTLTPTTVRRVGVSGGRIGISINGSVGIIDTTVYITEPESNTQIIADHTIVDDYANIPQQYIDLVKTMQVDYSGLSHASGILAGLNALETLNATYQVTTADAPMTATSSYLRACRNFYLGGWWGGLSPDAWYSNEAYREIMEAGLTYINETNATPLSVVGLGWSYTPDYSSADIAEYVEATERYNSYSTTNSYDTKFIYSTGAIDGDAITGETGWTRYLAHTAIRDSVNNDATRVLFDYADILCYDDNGSGPNTSTWDGHTFPVITDANKNPSEDSHISAAGELRLAKAMWWMLARIAGWDGN